MKKITKPVSAAAMTVGLAISGITYVNTTAQNHQDNGEIALDILLENMSIDRIFNDPEMIIVASSTADRKGDDGKDKGKKA